MADPFSIIAGVLGITTAVIQSSEVFLELVNDIRSGAEEVKAVSEDVHAFYAIVSSLHATLREVDVKDAIACDEILLTTIGNLALPLENCRVVLGELMVKIKQQLQPFPDDKRFRINTKSLKWSLFTKSEIRTLQRRLEATKTTLCSALDAITA
jgi:Fungal N-terminal domain of STAND proteins